MAAALRPDSTALESLLSARTVWRAGRSAAAEPLGEPTGFAALDALLPQGGWPCGALTELLIPADGVGELAVLMPTLARLTAAGTRVALVAPPYRPYAPSWQAAGVDLRWLDVVDGDARNALWAFEQCLRSAAFGAVLGWPLRADGPALRRLQVAADSGQCLGFAIRGRQHADNPSPAALRMEHVRGAWHVRKCRGAPAPAMPFLPEHAVPGHDLSEHAFPRGALPEHVLPGQIARGQGVPPPIVSRPPGATRPPFAPSRA